MSDDGAAHRPAVDVGALIARCALDDATAFATLYATVGSRVHGVILSIVRDPARAEEAAQEAFAQIWTRASECDVVSGSPMGWIISIARRRAIDCVRSEVARRRRDDHWMVDFDDIDLDDPGDIVISRASRQQVVDALAALPVDQSRLIRLAFYGGLTHVQLSDVTGLPLGTVKSRVRAGLRALGRSLGTGPR